MMLNFNNASQSLRQIARLNDEKIFFVLVLTSSQIWQEILRCGKLQRREKILVLAMRTPPLLLKVDVI